MLFLLVLLQATPPATGTSPTVPPMSLERAIRELERPTLRLEQKPADLPTFRVEVQEPLLSFEPWKDSGTSPWRLRVPRGHYEFLYAVTPEVFRAATIHPCCVEVIGLIGFVSDRLKDAARARREARAKQLVEQALRDWRAANAKDNAKDK